MVDAGVMMSNLQRSYEVFERSADIGLHACGRTLAELFVNVAPGVESLVVSPEQVRAVTGRPVTVEGHDEVSLLIEWLNDLIFLLDTEYLFFCDFAIDTISATRLTARVVGESYDAHCHELSSAIKAATWHEAVVNVRAEGYDAGVGFDI
jgi:protein archease